MKKTRYAVAGLFLLLIFNDRAIAQRVLYAEDFDAYPQVNFNLPWIVAGNTGSFPWRCDVPYVTFGPGFIYFDDKTKAAMTLSQGNSSNVLLATPPVIAGSSQPVYLSYDSYFQKQSAGGKSERASVEVSMDNGATWTVIGQAPVSSGQHMRRSYLALGAAASSAASIRLGFRYSDSLQALQGWIVDNIKVFVPAPIDAAIIHVLPEDSLQSYYAVPASVPLRGTIMNTGTTPITAFDVYYREGTGPVQRHAVTGVSIAPFDTLNFTHSIPYSLATMGAHSIQMWVSLPGDTLQRNDTLGLTLRGAAFLPAKKLVIEEGTGAWHMYGPRGYTFLHSLDTAATPPLRISVHSGDVMDHKVYADFLYYINQNFTPYFLFDRRGPVPYTTFYDTYSRQRDYFGYADIAMKGKITGNQMSIDASVLPAVDLTGQYRLALVLTENDVHGTAPAYDQANAYAGGMYGPMGGFENKPNPVPAADMHYDYVAREISPAPEGLAGCLPSFMQASTKYSCQLQTTIAAGWNRSKLNATVLLIRDRDSAILNARQMTLTALGVDDAAPTAGLSAVYPNPAAGSATIAITLLQPAMISVSVMDITGRMVYSEAPKLRAAGRQEIQLSTSEWPSGMYLISVQSDSGRETLKLTVLP